MDLTEQRDVPYLEWFPCIDPTPYRPILPQQHNHHEFFMPSHKFPFCLPPMERINGAGPVGAGNTLEMSREVPCRDLLALAHAASSTADKNPVVHGDPQFAFANHLGYDLNSLPESTYGQFAPITPQKASSNSDHRGHQNIEEQMNAGASTFKVFELGSNKDLVNHATDSSQTSLPTQLQDNQTQLQNNQTQLQENHSIIKEGNESIDLNQTPQLKQRRRKHRPKVIIEGKPKKNSKTS